MKFQNNVFGSFVNFGILKNESIILEIENPFFNIGSSGVSGSHCHKPTSNVPTNKQTKSFSRADRHHTSLFRLRHSRNEGTDGTACPHLCVCPDWPTWGYSQQWHWPRRGAKRLANHRQVGRRALLGPGRAQPPDGRSFSIAVARSFCCFLSSQNSTRSSVISQHECHSEVTFLVRRASRTISQNLSTFPLFHSIRKSSMG